MLDLSATITTMNHNHCDGGIMEYTISTSASTTIGQQTSSQTVVQAPQPSSNTSTPTSANPTLQHASSITAIAPPDGYYYTSTGPRRSIHPLQLKQQSTKHKCTQRCCNPSILFILLTLAMTALASLLLWFALTTQYWELMKYDKAIIKSMLANESEHVTVIWLFNDKAAKVTYGNQIPSTVSYLMPIHSGVWTSCIDILEDEYNQIVEDGYDKPFCIDHLQQNVLNKPNFTSDSRASWQHRMQNLAIACAMVCLILLSAAIVVGLFGIIRPQISAVLVTGVIYLLAALFALFTLTIVHLKHKNRKMYELLDIWTKLIDKNEEFQPARIILYSGWSFKLGWAGSFACVGASILWILLSKILRYNPKYI